MKNVRYVKSTDIRVVREGAIRDKKSKKAPQEVTTEAEEHCESSGDFLAPPEPSFYSCQFVITAWHPRVATLSRDGKEYKKWGKNGRAK